MHPIVRNILAVIAGVVIGSVVNYALVMAGPYPDGMILGDMESLKAFLPQFEPIHFLFPFLGHAVGTLVGAFLAAVIAGNRKMIFAMVIGAWFLLGGIANAAMVGGPIWFTILDIAVAYLPMAYLGYKIAGMLVKATPDEAQS